MPVWDTLITLYRNYYPRKETKMTDTKNVTERMSKDENREEYQPTEAVRTGTPRKSKAKELMIKEEFCVYCYGSPSSNDEDFEELLMCSECLKFAHATCLEMPLAAVEKTKMYAWQCNDCKGCYACGKKNKEKSIILCDFCDRGFHRFCLDKKPITQRNKSWKCPCCQEDDTELCSNENIIRKPEADQSLLVVTADKGEDKLTASQVMVNSDNSDTTKAESEKRNSDTQASAEAHSSKLLKCSDIKPKEAPIESMREESKDTHPANESAAESPPQSVSVKESTPRESMKDGSKTRSRKRKAFERIVKRGNDTAEALEPIEVGCGKEVDEVKGMEVMDDVKRGKQEDSFREIAKKPRGRSRRMKSGETLEVKNVSFGIEKLESDELAVKEDEAVREMEKVIEDEKISVESRSEIEVMDINAQDMAADIIRNADDDSSKRDTKKDAKDLDKGKNFVVEENKEDFSKKVTSDLAGREKISKRSSEKMAVDVSEEKKEGDGKGESEAKGDSERNVSEEGGRRFPKRKLRTPRESRNIVMEEKQGSEVNHESSSKKRKKEEDADSGKEEVQSQKEEEKKDVSTSSRRDLRSSEKVMRIAEEKDKGGSCDENKEEDNEPTRNALKNDLELQADTLEVQSETGKDLPSAEVECRPGENENSSSPRRTKKKKHYVRSRCSYRLSNDPGVPLDDSAASLHESVKMSPERQEEQKDPAVSSNQVKESDGTSKDMEHHGPSVKGDEVQKNESVTDDEIIDVVTSIDAKEGTDSNALCEDLNKHESLTTGNGGSEDVSKSKEDAEIVGATGGEAAMEQPVKRKRGRPSKKSQSGKQTIAPKLGGGRSTEKTRGQPDKEAREESPNTPRVLRKTSREPAITPTTARSILAAQASPSLHKQHSYKASQRTPLSKSPRTTPSRSTRHTPKSTPETLGRQNSATKLSSRERKKVSSPLKFSAARNSQKKVSVTKTSGQQSAEPRKRGRPPKNLTTHEDNSGREVSKRKLSFEEKQKDSKKMRTPSKKEAVPVRRPRGRPKATKREEDGESLVSQGSSDFENIVSAEDREMFKEALEKANIKVDVLNENALDQGIRKVEFGDYEIDTWYSSPYPSEYKILGKVFVCEYCLKYTKSATILRRHMAKCAWRHPPGNEIYRKGNISMFEVDGAKSQAYCQNLCLFAKLFLDHKTLYYEVEPFLFYVMTVADSSGCHIVGYFSKEKVSFLNYNVSCILVLPHCMQKGYGKVLIDFSYLLSRVEGKIGSPERPLSDLGLISYRSYWKDVLLRYLCTFQDAHVSIKEMSQKTSVLSNDLISTMQYLGMLKYWKGKHIITIQKEMVDAYEKKNKARDKIKMDIDESCLEWTPKDYGQAKGRAKML